MCCLLFLLLGFQDPGTAGPRWEPIPAGNRIDIGSFQFVIPDRCYYTGEENVHNMFRLAGADYIPNAVGMLFSTSATWDYSITVQHFPFQAFVLEPVLSEDELFQIFSKSHLYTLGPVEGQATWVHPPTVDAEKNSFALAMRYAEEDGNYVYIKKVWATPHDALVFSLKATEAAYQDDVEPISAALNAVTINGTPREGDESYEVISYLELLGLNPQLDLPETQRERKSSIWLSVLLAIGGLVLLFFAISILKKQKPASI